jgi:hypothetical protein
MLHTSVDALTRPRRRRAAVVLCARSVAGRRCILLHGTAKCPP